MGVDEFRYLTERHPPFMLEKHQVDDFDPRGISRQPDSTRPGRTLPPEGSLVTGVRRTGNPFRPVIEDGPLSGPSGSSPRYNPVKSFKSADDSSEGTTTGVGPSTVVIQ